MGNSEIKPRNRKIKMSTISILWGLSAGRCELCNRLLCQNQAFGLTGNFSQVAHIHAVGLQGPRNSSKLTDEELNNISNLMLLCYDDHKLIDSDPTAFASRFLVDQKKKHEQRIREATGISTKQTCQILTYYCGVKDDPDLFHADLLRQALLLSQKLPMQEEPLVLGKHSDLRYNPTREGFSSKAAELEKSYRFWNDNAGLERASLAVFSLAPMPLLMKLGELLGDRKNVTVFQCHRQGHKWAWPEGVIQDIKFFSKRTTPVNQGTVALVMDLSAGVVDSRITNVLGQDTTIYHITIEDPNRDFVTSEGIQAEFVKTYRNTLETIKCEHPSLQEIHVFPVLPNSLAIRAGMDYMSKTDPSMVIYEQDNSQEGFFEALRIGGKR